MEKGRKILLPVVECSMDSEIASRFGRAEKFLIYDTETETTECIVNETNSASHGAGIQAAQAVVESGASVLIAPHCGPKAYQVLEAAEIEVFFSKPVSVSENIKLYANGELQKITSSDAKGNK
jgi:predicted Fe-Mo cluster-binding NifX family protein